MQIQYYGDSCFKVFVKPGGRATDDVTLIFDPLDKKSGLRAVYGQAHVVVLSGQESQTDLSLLKGNPLIVRYPGEYSAHGMNIIGSGFEADGRFLTSTLYVVETEDIRIAFMGQTSAELSEKQGEIVDSVDILFVPVGGNSVLSAKKAAEIARNIEPHIIIPMCFSMPNLQTPYEDVRKFYEELGVEKKEPMAKFIIKAKDLEAKNMEIVELDPQR